MFLHRLLPFFKIVDEIIYLCVGICISKLILKIVKYSHTLVKLHQTNLQLKNNNN